MQTAATSAGFTVANRSDVTTLLNTLPLTNSEWPSYAAIMGQAPNRDLIWGAYLSNTNPVNLHSWAYSFSGDQTWSYATDVFNNTSVPNADTNFVDLNLWAYQTSAPPLPEPASLALLGLGLAGMGFTRRRRRA